MQTCKGNKLKEGKKKNEGKIKKSSPVFLQGVGARGEETAGKAQRFSLSDKSRKGQSIPVSVPTAAELWNKCIKFSKLPHSSKQVPDERISCICFSGTACCPQIILTIWRLSTLFKQTPRLMCYLHTQVQRQSDGSFDLSGLLLRTSLQMFFDYRAVIIQ